MGREVTKELAIEHKKSAIKKLNQTFENLINRGNPRFLKKADLIAYWIEEYSEYIKLEESFKYDRVMRYKRGDVIQLNFGFNLGSEQGGLHYAIVLDNDNLQSSPVVTVVPLSSGTEQETYSRDVYLGNELYEKVKHKYDKFSEQVNNDLKEKQKLTKVINSLRRNADKESEQDVDDVLKELDIHTEKLEEEKRQLEIYRKEVERLKNGSIALMEQITTVSKMRIYKPKSSADLLYHVKFSTVAMEKINQRMQELFIYKH